MAKNKDVRFVRIRGRVVPIRRKTARRSLGVAAGVAGAAGVGSLIVGSVRHEKASLWQESVSRTGKILDARIRSQREGKVSIGLSGDIKRHKAYKEASILARKSAVRATRIGAVSLLAGIGLTYFATRRKKRAK